MKDEAHTPDTLVYNKVGGDVQVQLSRMVIAKMEGRSQTGIVKAMRGGKQVAVKCSAGGGQC